jgi:glycerol-3-phosphate dehydrogenase (NAD(P)+)
VIDVAIVGAGNWGTTLAVMLARAGRSVRLCPRDAVRGAAMAAARENVYSLPGVSFPEALEVASGFTAAAGAATVVIAVASEYLRATGRVLAQALPVGTVLVSATKGLEHATALRGAEVLAQELPAFAADVCVLSGPNLAGEIAAGLPAAAVIAGANREVTAQAALMLGTRLFRLYTTDDVIGVELGGSLKNVVALAAGICDGLEMGVNAKAAIVTRGMAEIVRLGVACGAHAETFAGLSGFGDLFATCTSVSSRNHYVGEQLGRGRPLQAILDGMHMVAEGVATAPAALVLAAHSGVDLPITAEVCAVLFAGKPVDQAMDDLLARLMRDERTGEVV